MPETVARLHSRIEALLLTVPTATEAPTVAARDAQELRKLARATAE